MKRLRFIVSTVLLLSGCASFTGQTSVAPEERNLAQRAPASRVQALGGPSSLKGVLEGLYLQSPIATNSKFTIDVVDHIVVLSGPVSNLYEKSQLVDLAKSIPEVRAVVDLLELELVGTSDSELKKKILSGWRDHQGVEIYDLDVQVSQGKAELSGEVDSWAEKDVAERVARKTMGLLEVSNRIEVVLPEQSERSDQELRPEILAQLESSVIFDADQLNVIVEGGEVRISGGVPHLDAREQLYNLAWVSGVKSVDVTGVNILLRDSNEQRRLKEWSDEQIRANIKDAIRIDPRLRGGHVLLEVDSGSVVLLGAVGSSQAKEAAYQDALNTAGVWEADNRLRVEALPLLSDQMLYEYIKQSLEEHPLLSREKFEIDIRQGVVTLKGQVSSLFEKAEAGNVVSGIIGVDQVENQLHY